MRRNFHLSIALMLVLIVALIFSIGGGQSIQPVSAAPAAAITPVAATSPVSGDTSAVLVFFDGEALTADTQRCRDLRGFRTLDLEYVVDQGETNTTTVTLEHTNGAGADLTVNTTGQTVVSANAADADGLNRFDLYGIHTCVDVNVTNSETITWTVIGIARK